MGLEEETDRQTHTDRLVERQTDTQTDRQTDTHTHRQASVETDRETHTLHQSRHTASRQT